MLKKGDDKSAKSKEPNSPKPVKAPKEKKPKKAKDTHIYEPKRIDPVIRGALGWLDLSRKTPATMIVQARAHSKASPERIWEIFSDLEKWPTWTKPLITKAKWVHGNEWLSGAQFEQTVNYGFPFSGKPSVETIKDCIPAQSVAWLKSAKGVKTIHLWYFQPNIDGTCDIVNTEVMYGQAIFFVNLIGARRKQAKMFQTVVDNLIRMAERGNS
jgi:hypothetical protein